MGPLLRGRYEVLKKLGEGAFGETYKAKDHERPSKPFCLVKRLKPVHTNQIVRDFFDREAAVLERLGEHPQIPRLLAHFTVGQELFIVQEFIEGHSLRREIILGRQLNETSVMQVVQDVLEILTFVHQNGVVHRDIKPENLMRRHDGKLILIDFGAVKELGSVIVTPSGEIQTSVVAGTHGYMPIEQLRGKPGRHSDIYALGMMAIEALTGIYPTRLPDDPYTGKILWRDYAQVSDRLAEVLETMVQILYSKRYPSAIEALQALQSIANSQFSSRSISWSRRRVIKSVGLATTSMVAMAVGGRLMRQQRFRAFIDLSQLQIFQFETVIVNAQGAVVDRPMGQARFFVENLGGVQLEMVEIPGGTFWMGSPEDEKGRFPDESPQREVNIPSFFIGKFPITQAQYEAVIGRNPSNFKGATHPVEMVSWNEAVEFCQLLSRHTGRAYQLPSEAQWEYACRAGTTTPFHYGETLTTALANYNGSNALLGFSPIYHSEPKGEYRQQTTEVGRFPPNAFGLCDMHGNVWEWCQDIWHENYKGAPTDGSAWMAAEPFSDRYLLRGGAWNGSPRSCRSANRISNLSDNRDINDGFRVVCQFG
ncbi:protein kinase [filamentous cyanobacterium CCP2]|nr:protein kinase [filamentous cyanobacterium CCP2]